MEQLIPLNNKKTKQILTTINEQFDLDSEILKEYAFFLRKKDLSIKIISREISEVMDKRVNIDSMGLRIGKEFSDGIALTIEGSQLIGPHSKKNIVEINKEDMEKWIKGFDLETETNDNRFVILKYNNDFLGSGKQKENTIINNIPKSRRINSSDMP